MSAGGSPAAGVDVPRVLYVTDPDYVARGRDYGREDELLCARFADLFDLTVCGPQQAPDLMTGVDVTVVRNTGPTADYPAAYTRFRETAAAGGLRVYNELTGRADMLGKQYLVDLTTAGWPVIPTVTAIDQVDRFGPVDRYVVKPIDGADSSGLEFRSRDELHDRPVPPRSLIQPAVDFAYEVSFYFVDHAFQYALATPDPSARWELEPYTAAASDVAFAQRFINWNRIEHGIQRVDACRTRSGQLLLVELEDLNPFLSLDRTTPQHREAFIDAFAQAVRTHARPPRP